MPPTPRAPEEVRMSKASEYAKEYAASEAEHDRLEEARKALTWYCPVGGCYAEVRAAGELLLRVSEHNWAIVPAEHALSFARWILDTFGEPER